MNPEMDVRCNGDTGSYEAVVDGQVVGMIVYHVPRGARRVTLSHTIVEPEYRDLVDDRFPGRATVPDRAPRERAAAE